MQEHILYPCLKNRQQCLRWYGLQQWSIIYQLCKPKISALLINSQRLGQEKNCFLIIIMITVYIHCIYILLQSVIDLILLLDAELWIHYHYMSKRSIIGSIKLFRLESITQWMELPVLKKRVHCNFCSKDRVIDVTFWCHSLFLNTHLPFKELSPKTCSFHCIQFLIWFKLRRFNLKNMIKFLIFCIHFC